MTEPAAPTPAEAALLAVCASPDGDHAPLLRDLGDPDWHALAALAANQRSVPLVRAAIARSGVAAPGPVGRELDARTMVHAQEMVRQKAALAQLVRVLGQHGLAPVALKGVRLAWSEFPQPVLRPMRDLDLLLAPAEAEKAQGLLLTQADYELLDPAVKYGIEHGHQLPPILDARNNVLIEVHHRLNARGWRQEPALTAQILAERETLELGDGLTVQVPSAQANVLHLVEHATLHHLFDNGPLVLADLHFALSAPALDSRALFDRASELGLARAFGLVHALARRHGARWPAAMPADIAFPAPSSDQLALAEAALLRSDAARREVALLRRYALRSGGRRGPRAAIGAMLTPDPSVLARFTGADPASPLRWAGYPLWLVDRLADYGRALRGSKRANEASGQVSLHRWLHGE